MMNTFATISIFFTALIANVFTQPIYSFILGKTDPAERVSWRGMFWNKS